MVYPFFSHAHEATHRLLPQQPGDKAGHSNAEAQASAESMKWRTVQFKAPDIPVIDH